MVLLDFDSVSWYLNQDSPKNEIIRLILPNSLLNFKNESILGASLKIHQIKQTMS